MKKCNKCLNDLENSCFSPDKRNNDGLQSTCRECYNKKRREKYLSDESYNKSCKERQKKYNKYALEKALKHVREVSDTYVIAELKRGTTLTTEDIRKFPELIETKRQTILNKRLCRILKN